MSSSKRQSLIVIGVALILIGGILAYFSLSMPRIYVDEGTSETLYEQELISDDTITVNTATTQVSVSYPVNINTCTVAELSSIDGIGDTKASAIIEYRDYIGGYTSVEQIKNIKGIGDSVYEKISPYLCV